MEYVTLKTKKGEEFTIDKEDYERVSKVSWYNHCGYMRARMGKKLVSLHRYLLDLSTEEKRQVDHIDRNKLNNCKSNLRLATASQNGANRRRQVNSINNYKGVSWKKDKKKWTASITQNGKQKHIGYYTTEEGAAIAYNEKAIELFGDFACINVFLPFC